MELNDRRLGLTPKRIEALRSLGISSSEALLTYYPSRYDILNCSDPSSWKEKDRVSFEGTVAGRVFTSYFKGRAVSRFQVLSNDIVIAVTIFNRPWARSLKDGEVITVTGIYQGKRRVTAISYTSKSMEEQDRITPVYSVKAGIQQRTVRDSIRKAMDAALAEIDDLLPIRFQRAYRLCSKTDALRFMHEPKSEEDIRQAMRRLKYEEFLQFFTAMELLKSDHGQGIYKAPKAYDPSRIEAIIQSLSFELTAGQKDALNDILKDLSSTTPMMRLLQGDVGCGKTVVAAIAMAAAADAGYQAALLAPTEVLARQHLESLRTMLGSVGYTIDVLYSGLSNVEKEDVLHRIATGETQLIVGTHSLLQENVEFARLGFVAADEQQRFGVNQRKVLREKGVQTDFLLMSATPIPRTLAASIFGEMNVSAIETLPSGRKPVTTVLVKENSFRSVLDDVLDLLSNGHQLYVITAAIEKQEETPSRAAEDVVKALRTLFKNYTVALLHGRMSSSEKEEVMRQFYDNEAQILVSTTVVEVGMNVVNATGMIIYDSERFGLSQLHQLRGRVQRGSEQGYCWLLTGSKEETALERLNVLVNTTDGFQIAAEDLRLRGPGDILGTRQSGLPGLVLGSLYDDTAVMNTARKDAVTMMEDSLNPDFIPFLDAVRERSAEHGMAVD